MIPSPKGQLLTRYSPLSLQFRPLQHRPPYKQETGIGTKGTKIGVGIGSNEIKRVEIEVPAEVGIRREATGKGIPKKGMGKNQGLSPLGRRTSLTCLKTEINCRRLLTITSGISVLDVATPPIKGGIAEPILIAPPL